MYVLLLPPVLKVKEHHTVSIPLDFARDTHQKKFVTIAVL